MAVQGSGPRAVFAAILGLRHRDHVVSYGEIMGAELWGTAKKRNIETIMNALFQNIPKYFALWLWRGQEIGRYLALV